MLLDSILLIETFKPILPAAWTCEFFVAFYFDYLDSWDVSLTVRAKNCILVYTLTTLLVEIKSTANTSTRLAFSST